MKLRRFQTRFVTAATSGRYRQAALSLPRGNGKSQLAGYLGARLLTPGDSMFRPGTESVVIASTLEQGRIVYRFARDLLGDDSDYRLSDSLTRVQIMHKPTRTALQVRSSNSKGVLGLVNTPWILADEPGAWAVSEGQAMYDAITTSAGKPDSPLTAIFLGTIAPAAAGWWADMVSAGTSGSVYVQRLQGDAATWSAWPTVKKANPLMSTFPESRKVLLEEREEARRDPRLKARFLSYRLNLPSADASTTLLTVDDWELLTARPVPARQGRPLVAVDLGAGRAWSAAVALWQNGRVEALALAPGVPGLPEQEKRDRAPPGTYQALESAGQLHVAGGLRVQPAAMLADLIRETWGDPVSVIADRFRVNDLVDAGLARVEPRMTRWSESSADIRALRKIAVDGPLTVDPASAPLIAASLATALVKNDDAGNVRLVKRGSNNTSRDDVASALTLAAGGFVRRQPTKARRGVYRGKA